MNERVTASPQIIMKAALELARSEGWAGVSMRKVAQRINYTAPIVYEHFQNKDDLVAAIAESGLRELRLTLAKVWEEQAEASHPSLASVALAYWSYAERNPEAYEAFSLRGDLKSSRTGLKKEVDQLCESITTMVTQLAKRRGFAGLPARKITDQIWAILHGFVSLGLSEQLGSHADVRAQIVDVIESLERSWMRR